MSFNWKKVLSLVMALAMILSFVPTNFAHAEESETQVTYVAKVGDVQYESLTDALNNAAAGDTITLLADATFSGQNAADKLSGYVIDLNDKTVTLSGNTYLTGETTIKNGKVVVSGFVSDSYLCLYTADTKLTLDDVTLTGTMDCYAVLNGAAGSTLIIKDSTIDVVGDVTNPDAMGNIIYGGNVTVDHSTIKGDNTVRGIGFSNIKIQNGSTVEISNVETGLNCATVTVDNSTVTITNATKRAVRLNNNALTLQNGAELSATNCAEGIIGIGTTDTVSVSSDSTLNAVDKVTPAPVYVAQVGEQGYATLAEAVAVGGNITLLTDVALDAPLVVTGTVVLDLAGKKVSFDSTVQGEAMITNKGDLTINDSVGGGEIYYNYTGAADSTYSKGNYTISNAGTLTVNGGKIHIANLSGHAKYPIDNNSTTGNAVLVINGGHLYNYNTSAIRQFCNSTTNTNSVTITGGLIEGYSAIWMQNPGSKTVNGALSITGGEVKSTAKAYVNGTSELKDVSSAIYCSAEGGAWSEISAVSITGGTINENVDLAEEAPAAITIGEDATFNGNVELPAAPANYVAYIGETGYETLQAAIDAAYAAGGEVTITLADDVTENVTVTEKVGLYLTIDGADKTMNGTVTVKALSDTNDNRRTTIQKVNFVNSADTGVDFITSNETNHYPRLSVLNCSFTGNGKAADVAVRTKSAYDLIIKDCTGTGLHSFLQNTSGVKITVQNVTVSDSKGGLAMGTAQNVEIRNCNLTTRTYGIRLDAVLDTSVTLNGNVVNAYIPVSVRKATANEYKVTLSGSASSYTATNPDDVWMAICATEYEDGVALNAPTGNVKLTNYTNALDLSKVYGAYEYPVIAVYSDGYTKGFDSLTSAMNYGYSGGSQVKIIVNEDITEEMDILEGNITTDNPNGVTIKNTIVDAWIYCSENFTIGEGVTYDATGYESGLFMYADNAVINGTVLTDCYYQRYADTKLTINEPGSMTVKTETFILRYTDGDADAGIYIVGDNNDETVGLTASVIYFYQGCINAKDADIKVGTYWQTQGTDNAGSANLILDNTNMTVTVNEHNFKATGDSTVTLTNGSHVTVAGGYEGVDVSKDATSTFTVGKGEVNFAPTPVAMIGETGYATLAEAVAAVQEGETITILTGTISEGTIKLPATLTNVTFKGETGAVLKDMTIMASDGNSFSYVGLTFDGITFDNSRLSFTGWRNGEEVIENLTITNCVFQNLYDTTNSAAVHINKDVSEPVNGFTFTNNVIDGATGGSKSGIYTVNTGKVTITGNTFNNIVFRPALVQLADCDGVQDDVVISNNVISNTTRLQVYGSEADDGLTPIGTDPLNISINENVFKNITGYYICTWGINGESDITKNYYDSEDLSGKIYWNNIKPTDVAGLIEIGVYPYYADEAKTTLVTAPAIMVTYADGTVEYFNDMREAVPHTTNYPKLEGATITLMKDMEGLGMRFMENGMVFDLNGHTYTLTGGTGSKGTETSGFQIRPEVTTTATIKNGTIKLAEGVQICWMFNCYATDFVVEDVTVDCANMAWSYGESCYVVVSREGDNVQFTGTTKVINFKSDVAGAAINVGGTMTIGENVVPGGSFELDAGAVLTAPAGLDVVTADGYKVVYADGKYTSVSTVIQVSTKAELDDALAVAQEGDTIRLTDDIDYGTDQLKVEKAITLDLGGKTLTTRNAYGGMSVKNNPTIKNGTIVHASNTSAIKVWNAAAFEDLVIDVQGKGDANKTIGGIVLQSGTTTHVGSIKNVTIKGDALTNGIETYNCGDAAQNVIGSMENVTIDAKGTGMLISAPCGTATNCSISGDVNGIELWIKGNYSASLNLVDCDVEGGVFAHDEFSSNPSIVNNGTLKLTVDDATTGVEVEDITLTIARAENVTGTELKYIMDNAQAKVNDTYYLTLTEAMKAAQAGDTVTILAGDYTTDVSVNKAITVVGETDANGNNLVTINGTVSVTGNGATVKNLNVKVSVENEETALYINGGNILIEGCNVSGYNVTRYSYVQAGGVTFKNCVLDGYDYTLHFDTLSGDLTIDGCTLDDWSAIGAGGNVIVKNSTFKVGESAYNTLRTWTNATYDNCTFEKGFDLDLAGSAENLAVTNSKFSDGTPVDITLFRANDTEKYNITVDGVKMSYAAKIGNTYYKTIADAIKAANAGDEVFIFAGTYALPAMKTGITVVGEVNADGTPAVLLEGTLSGTLENLTLKNLHIKGGNAQRWAYAKGNLVFENVTFEATSVYALHFDGITEGANLLYKDCTIIGWAAMSGSPASCVFDGCTIKGNGSYGVIRTYFDATIENCTFDVDNVNTTDVYQDGIHAVGGAEVTVNNCTNVNGDMKDLVNISTTSVVVLDGVKIQNVAKVTSGEGEEAVTTYYLTLDEAVKAAQAGDEVTILAAGTYKVPTGKNITITGAVEGVKFDMSKAVGVNASMTFNNVTFEYGNANYVGLQHAGTMVYNNCTINGQVFLYGTSETFNNCTFNQISSDAYNVWTYGAKEVEFNECTFNSAGKSVLIYAEGASIFNDVTVTDCDFIASAAVDGKAAIEMDSSLTSGINLTIDGATTATGFGSGNVSGNSLWNNKKGSNTDANNDITVVVDNVTVLAPATFAAKIGDTGYTTIADAIKAAQPGQTVTILAGNYTTNLDVNKAITVVGEGTVNITGKLNITADGATVKNLKFNNGSGNGGYINAKDVLVEGCTVVGGNGFRSCYTKGTVTFKDSTITGNVYGIHFDGSAGGEIVIDNCVITGWTSFAASIKKVTMTDTTFEEGNYNYVRFYQEEVVIDGCTFNEDMAIDLVDVETVTVTNSKVTNGTVEGLFSDADIVDATITVDGVELTRAAKIGNTYYKTIAEALAAAKAGDTVDLLGNSFVDAAGFSLNGFTLANGSITFKKGARIGVHGNAVLDNVDLTFDMDGTSGYPNTAIYINGGSATSLTLKNGSDVLIKNPGYTAIYNDGTTAYALNIDNSTLTIEGKGTSTGINGANITLTNGKLTTSDTGIAINGGSVKVDGTSAVTVDGTNSHGITNVVLTVAAGGKVDVDDCAYLGLNIQSGSSIAEGATVTVDNCGTAGNYVGIPARVNGTTGEDQIQVDSQKIVAKGVSGNAFTSIDAAIKAAKADETVTILAGNYTTDVSVNKAITVVGETDDQGNNLVNITGGIDITADGATVKNLTASDPATSGYNSTLYINAKNVLVEGCVITDTNALRYSETDGTVTFKDSTITGSVYGIHFDGSAGGNIVIDNCVITGWTSFAGTIEKVTIKDTTFAEGNYNYIRFYQDADISGCTFNEKMAVDVANSVSATVTVTDSTLVNGNVEDLFDGADVVNSTIIVDGVKLTYVAKIGNTYYATLEEALANVADLTTIKLVANATLDYNAREAYGRDTTTDIIIDGQGFTLTLNQKDSDWSSIGMANADGKLTLKNMTIEKTGYGDTTGAWNTHAIIFSCNVEMKDVTVNNGIAVQNGATLNNVTINEANGYYGLWINGNGQTVTVNGGAINATNGGRGIKIADQYIDAPASVNLTVDGTKFNTAKKAAVLVTSTAGAQITASNVDITKVAEDTVNFVWVDEDRAANFGNVEVTGATKAQEAVETFNIVVKDGDKIVSYFKTLDELFDNVSAYAKVSNVTVELMGDVVATKVVKTNSLKTYNFVTNVAGGVTMDLQYADNWNYFRKVNIGEGVTVKAKYLVFSTESTIAGTVDSYYPYISGAKVTVTETGVLKYEGGDALQVKGNGAVLTVNGTVIAPTINVWAGNAQLIVSGANAKIESNWIDIWDGAPTVKIENGATIETKAIKVSRGGEITVNDATLTAETIEVGHNGNSAGVLTETGNSTINGQIKMTAIGSVVNSDGGLNVTTNIADHKVVHENGQYKVVPMVYVAQVGEKKYESLQAAINAAQPGETIVFLADITEDVTVSKNLTIDGADKTYTGTMTVKTSLTVTVQNVKFVKGCIMEAKGTGGNLTVMNCDFDGVDETIAYAVTMRGGSSVTVVGGTVKGYDYGFLYVPSAVTNVTVKNVTVEGMGYGVHVAYGSKISLESVKMNGTLYGIMTQNYGAKTITLKDCSINATDGIYVWERNTTVSDTFVFEGVNEITGMTTSKQAVLKAATIDGTNLYGDLVSMVNKADNGQTVKLLGNVTLDGSKTVTESQFGYETLVYVNGKTITIDFNGNTVEVTPNAPNANGGLAGTIEAVIFVGNGANLTLTDSSAEKNGGIKVNAGTDLYSLIYNAEATLTVENGVYNVAETVATGSLIYGDEPQTTTIKGGSFTLGNVCTVADTTKPWIINVEGKNVDFVDILGGTYNQDLLMNYGSQKDCEVLIPRTLALKDNGNKTWTIVDAVAYVGNGEYNNGYATLAEAIAAAANGETVTLLKDVTVTDTVIVDKTITLDLNGNNIENTGSAWVLKVDGNSVLTLTDSSAEKDGTIVGTKGISVVQGSKLIMDGGNINVNGDTGAAIQVYGSEAVMNGGKITAEYGAILIYSNNDVRGTFTMNGGEMVTKMPAIYANGSDQWDDVDVTINDGKITSETAAIYWPAAGKLTIKGGELTGKTAVYVKSGSLEITGGKLTATGDKVEYAYVTSSFKLTGDALVIENVGGTSGYQAVGSVVVSGGTFVSANASAVASYAPDGVTAASKFISGGIFSNEVPMALCAEGYFPVENTNNTWTVVPLSESGIVAQNEATGEYYKTVSEALAAAKSGATVKLVQDATETYVLVTPGVTLDLNGKTLTASYVVALGNGNVVDNTRTGLLKVSADCVVLNTSNAMVPVWNGTGYVFTAYAFVDNAQGMGLTVKADGTASFKFKPFFGSNVNGLVSNGVADNHLSIIVRMTWETETGKAAQDFIYKDEHISAVLNSGSAYFTLDVSGIENLTNFTITAMIISDTGAEFSGTPHSVN